MVIQVGIVSIAVVIGREVIEKVVEFFGQFFESVADLLEHFSQFLL